MKFQYDHYSPRPSTRIHLISGTEGMCQRDPQPPRIYTNEVGRWLNDEEYKMVVDQYTPEIVKRIGDMAREIGGHGGLDTIMDWRLVDCLRNGLPLDMSVYDAALWSAIAPLSEKSIANRSQSVDVPDFTGGAWETNEITMDLELRQGGTTRII